MVRYTLKYGVMMNVATYYRIMMKEVAEEEEKEEVRRTP